ncbi:unnamed protein product [Dibothriocephalus latus]|uniref:Uncharacterized protein n=1 Tax=Dibothriocephalus latus TaxID=60516 RepID=A0A3P6S7T6_DIBLA|nr:unnamed protein product [Dibothriocephalus latus]
MGGVLITHGKLIDFLCMISAIANLRRLAHFDVRANRISELPCCLTTLKELESLGISNNPLTFPPLSIASRGLPHILAFLSVRGEDTSPESPDSPFSGLAVTPKISVVVPRYSGSEEEEEEERMPPEQEMKEVPETKASPSPSVRPRHLASNWWRIPSSQSPQAPPEHPLRLPEYELHNGQKLKSARLFVDLKRYMQRPRMGPLGDRFLFPIHIQHHLCLLHRLKSPTPFNDHLAPDRLDSTLPFTKKQLGDDQERSQVLPIPATQPRVTRPAMYLPDEDSESDDSDDSESDLVSPPLHRPCPPKSRPHTQSRQEAEISSRSTVYRPPPTVNRRNGAANYGQAQAYDSPSDSIGNPRGRLPRARPLS